MNNGDSVSRKISEYFYVNSKAQTISNSYLLINSKHNADIEVDYTENFCLSW